MNKPSSVLRCAMGLQNQAQPTPPYLFTQAPDYSQNITAAAHLITHKNNTATTHLITHKQYPHVHNHPCRRDCAAPLCCTLSLVHTGVCPTNLPVKNPLLPSHKTHPFCEHTKHIHTLDTHTLENTLNKTPEYTMQ